jgi:imidazolonepropionase-like amidohydrolase
VIVKALNNLPTEFDRLGTRFDNAARLDSAGVPVAISTFDTHNARTLRLEAGNAVRYGMDPDAALRAVTLTPAEVLGVADTHGSLEVGKTANLVVWSGDPFEPLTSVEHVFISGEEMPDDSRQKRLLRRYDDLGNRPPAYDDGAPK